jgi:alpha-tubulin suppressor-like RCC1 family protein
VEQIACGSQHTIALCEDGQVYSWGCGRHGRLGHGGVADYTEPKLVSRFVLSPEQSIIQVAAGDSHSMALDREGRVFSWGSGSYGRLGSGQELDQYIPTQVQGKLKGVYAISISCNAFHSLAVTRANGGSNKGGTSSNVTLYTWGGGKYGKLGLDSERNQLSPQAVIFQGHNRQVIKAVCGLHHTVCVMQDSSVYAFGYGGGSRCGVEVDDLVVKTPREINFLRDAGIYKRYQLPKGDVMMKKYRADMVTAGEAHTLTLADSMSLFTPLCLPSPCPCCSLMSCVLW